MKPEVIESLNLKVTDKVIGYSDLSPVPVYEFGDYPNLYISEYDMIADRPCRNGLVCCVHYTKRKYVYINIQMLEEKEFIISVFKDEGMI